MSVETIQHIDIEDIRSQFPVLHQEVNGKPLIYFDNAATSQKPRRVIEALSHYYEQDNSNIHRGVHALAERATNAYEKTRKNLAGFIHANETEEVVFTKGTTDSINLVAQAYGRKFLTKDDAILITGMEHHSNIVPWQMLAQQTGASLLVAPITKEGEIIWEEFVSLFNDHNVKIVSTCYVSNTLGTINPVEDIITIAHEQGAVVMLDGAQACPHINIDVKKLDVDFLGFSGHKMYGPTGVGILYGKRRLLEKMDPYQGGGEMIKDVSFEKTTYNDIPYKFEAGTPNIADVVAWNEAVNFMDDIGIERLAEHEQALLEYASAKLRTIDGFDPLGTAKNKASVISFNIDGIHPFDLGMFMDAGGVAIRTGHHCTQPIMDQFGLEGTARASFAVYNTFEEIDQFVEVLNRTVKKFR